MVSSVNAVDETCQWHVSTSQGASEEAFCEWRVQRALGGRKESYRKPFDPNSRRPSCGRLFFTLTYPHAHLPPQTLVIH